MSIGPHVSKGKDFIENIEKEKKTAKKYKYDFNVISIFVASPRRKDIITMTEPQKFKEYCAKHNLRCYAHNTYVSVPVKEHKFILEQAKICKAAGIIGLVVHLGKEDFPTSIFTNLGRSDVRIYLELPPLIYSPYSTPEQINNLYRKIKHYGNFGICIDTAHLWISGVSMKYYDETRTWFNQLDTDIPLLIHLNDSKNDFHTGPDRHDTLREGKIWSDVAMKDSGLKFIIEFSKKNHIDCILERPGGYDNDYKLLA